MRRLILAAMLAVILPSGAGIVNAAALTVDDIEKKPAKEIEANLPDSHPMAYFAYAIKLFKAKKYDPAVQWFYVGQIRYRQYLLANPELPATGDPAQYKDIVEGGFGKAVSDYSGGNVRIWTQTIDDALAWDQKSPNNSVSKETYAAQWQQARAEVTKERDRIKKSEAQIKAERASQGLTDR
ncbi:MAG: hypothetical protein ABW278_03780 [Steroidobacteraceae bacterium]